MAWLAPPTELCEPWDISLSCCKFSGELSEGEQDEIILWASNELWQATGQRIGLCTSTVHFCREPCERRWSWAWWCHECPPYDLVDLGPDWVTEVTSVKIDGVALTQTTDWLVLDWRWLAKVSGDWPDTGLTIIYEHGTPPDPVALRNGEILACEEAKRRSGDKDCRLARTRSARRDGRFEIPEIDAWVSLQNREDDCGMDAPEKIERFYQVTSGS